MKRVLFSVGINAVEALGSVTRMVAIAQEIRKLKPETVILFRTAGTEAEHVRKQGFETVSGYKPNIFGLPDWVLKVMSLGKKWDGTTPYMKGMDDLIRMKGLHTKIFVEKTYPEWDNLIKEFKPDVIASEFDFIAPIAAAKYRIPHFTTFQSPGKPVFYSELFYSKPEMNNRLHKYYN